MKLKAQWSQHAISQSYVRHVHHRLGVLIKRLSNSGGGIVKCSATLFETFGQKYSTILVASDCQQCRKRAPTRAFFMFKWYEHIKNNEFVACCRRIEIAAVLNVDQIPSARLDENTRRL